MNKGEIYQNGFYLMVGAILGIIGTCTFNSVTTQQEVLIKTEVKRDTIVAMRPELNEHNLKEKLARLPHHDVVFKQAKLESRLGKSKVYKRTNNLFGLRKTESIGLMITGRNAWMITSASSRPDTKADVITPFSRE